MLDAGGDTLLPTHGTVRSAIPGSAERPQWDPRPIGAAARHGWGQGWVALRVEDRRPIDRTLDGARPAARRSPSPEDHPKSIVPDRIRVRTLLQGVEPSSSQGMVTEPNPCFCGDPNRMLYMNPRRTLGIQALKPEPMVRARSDSVRAKDSHHRQVAAQLQSLLHDLHRAESK